MTTLIKVAQTSDVPPGTGRVIETEGHSIAVFNVDGTFHAIDNICPHQGGPLGEGDLQGNTVTCPWHGAQFNVTTGELLSPPAKKGVITYNVHIQGNDIAIEI